MEYTLASFFGTTFPEVLTNSLISPIVGFVVNNLYFSLMLEEGSPVNLFHARNATRIIATIYLIDHIKFKTILNFCFKLSIKSLFFVEKSFVESIARKVKGFNLLTII